MGYIYKIWNEANNKLYIGQTSIGIKSRWAAHLKNYPTNNAVLYRAMRSHGVDIFHIEQIEECPNDLLDEREKYWIAFYDSYKNGYNSTPGGTALPSGNAPQRANNTPIHQLWDKGYSISEIAEKSGSSTTTVRDHLEDYPNYSVEESIRRGINKGAKTRSQAISQWSLQGKFIKTFISATKAAEETCISCQNINKCLHKERQSAGGFYWTHEGELPNITKNKQVYQYDKAGNLIAVFQTKAEAANKYGLDSGSIAKVCKGQRKTCGGYIWREE